MIDSILFKYILRSISAKCTDFIQIKVKLFLIEFLFSFSLFLPLIVSGTVCGPDCGSFSTRETFSYNFHAYLYVFSLWTRTFFCLCSAFFQSSSIPLCVISLVPHEFKSEKQIHLNKRFLVTQEVIHEKVTHHINLKHFQTI